MSERETATGGPSMSQRESELSPTTFQDPPVRRPPLLLGRLILLALANGLLWASIVPPWQAPDEPKHFEYIRLLAEGDGVVVFATESEAADPELQSAILRSMDQHHFWWYGRAPGYSADAPPETFADAWKLGSHTAYYRASPAYYWLASLIQPADRATGLYAARLLSVILGALVVLLGGLMAREAFPDDPLIRIGTPAFLALHPMVAVVHSGVNSDALVNALVAVALLVATRLVVRGAAPASVVALLLTLGAAASVKRIGLAVAPALLAAVAARAALRARRPGRIVVGVGVAGILLAAACAAWLASGAPAPLPEAWRFALLRYLFNEPDQAERIAGVLRTPAAWRHLLGFGALIIDGFWGRFGWEVIALPRPLAWSLNAGAILAAVGLVRGARRGRFSREQLAVIGVSAVALVSVVAAAVAFFAASLATPFAQPPQGRYLITVAPAAAILIAAGLSGWIEPERRAAAARAWVVALIVFDLAVLLGLVVPFFYT